jgi:hypothetical protein
MFAVILTDWISGGRDDDMIATLSVEVEKRSRSGRKLCSRPSLHRMLPRTARHARANSADGGPLRLCLLWPAGHLHRHPQGFGQGALPYGASADRTKTALAMRDAAFARGDCKVHEANRLAGDSAAGTGNASVGAIWYFGPRNVRFQDKG